MYGDGTLFYLTIQVYLGPAFLCIYKKLLANVQLPRVSCHGTYPGVQGTVVLMGCLDYGIWGMLKHGTNLYSLKL